MPPLSAQTLGILRRLEKLRSRAVRVLGRAAARRSHIDEKVSVDLAALSNMDELLSEMIAAIWTSRPARSRELRDLAEAVAEIEPGMETVLGVLERSIPSVAPRVAGRPRKESPIDPSAPASLHRTFEGPGGPFHRGQGGPAQRRLESTAWDALELAQSGESEQAIVLADSVLEAAPHNLTALQALVSGYHDEGLLQLAEEEARRAIAVAVDELGSDAAESRAWYGEHETRPYMRLRYDLGVLLWELGRSDESLEIFRDLLERNPNDNQGVRHLYPTLLLRDARRDEAVAAFEEVGRRYPQDLPEPGFALNWVLALLAVGRTEEAVTRARCAALANIYIIPLVLGRPTRDEPIWHGINTAERPWAEDYAETYGPLWNADKRLRTFLRRFWDDEDTASDVSRYVEIGRRMAEESEQHSQRRGKGPGPLWSQLIAEREALCNRPPTPGTIGRVLRATKSG